MARPASATTAARRRGAPACPRRRASRAGAGRPPPSSRARSRATAPTAIRARARPPASRLLVDSFVRGNGEELDEVVAQRDLLEELAPLAEPRAAVELAHLVLD